MERDNSLVDSIITKTIISNSQDEMIAMPKVGKKVVKMNPKTSSDEEESLKENLHPKPEKIEIEMADEEVEEKENFEIQHLLEKYQQLQTKLRNKDDLIIRMKAAMENDDLIKLEMRNKISELREKLRMLKEEAKNVELLNDDEIAELMKDFHDKNAEKDEEIEDKELLSLTNISVNNLNILKNNQAIPGNAMLNDYQTRIYLANSKTCWGKFIIWWDSVCEWILPFKKEISYISHRCDKNVEGQFLFARFLFIFNIIVSLSAIYLLINHLIVIDTTNDSTFCTTFIPCAILYSRFTAVEKNICSFTFVAICAVIFVGLVYKWTEFRRHVILQKLFDSENVAYSKVVFNLWDWSANNEDKKEDTRHMLKNLFTIGLSEKEIKEKIKLRTTKEKCHLFFRRVLSLFLSLLLLIFDAGLVTGLYLLQGYLFYINDNSSSDGLLYYLAIGIPPIGILVINFIIPLLLELCVNFEKWDFNSTKTVQLMWRVYISKIFTMGIVYVLVILFTILGKTTSNVFSTNSFDFGLTLTCSSSATVVNNTSTLSGFTLQAYTGYANCKQDSAAANLFTNLLVDFVSRKIIPPLILLFRYLYYRKTMHKKKFKAHYDTTDSVTDNLLFNIQIYMLVPYFPYILWLSPILLYIDFKFEYINVKYYFEKPEKLSLQEKTGFFIMTLFAFTMIGVVGVFIIYFVSSITNTGFMKCYQNSVNQIYEYYDTSLSCGPFSNNEAPKQTLYDTIQNSHL